MIQRLSVFLFSILIVFTSCNSENLLSFSYDEGDCLQEINKRYIASSSERKGMLYRIDKVDKNDVLISTWHNGGWLQIGRKPYSYFDEGKTFKYDTTSCPDGRAKDKAITDKIKSIDV